MTEGTRILFVGDIVGGLGKRTLFGLLPAVRERLAVDFVVVNGENVAGGVGITPLRALFEALPGGPGDLTLIYRARSERELMFRAELTEIAHRREAPLQVAHAGPMRRGAASVEQPRFREEERARAHARDPGGRAGELPDGRDLARLAHRLRIPSRHEERVGDGPVGWACVDGDARVSDDSAAVERQHLHVVEALSPDLVGGPEGVQRSRQVEELVAGMDVEQDQARHGAF